MEARYGLYWPSPAAEHRTLILLEDEYNFYCSEIALRKEAALWRYTILDRQMKEEGYLMRCAKTACLVPPTRVVRSLGQREMNLIEARKVSEN